MDERNPDWLEQVLQTCTIVSEGRRRGRQGVESSRQEVGPGTRTVLIEYLLDKKQSNASRNASQPALRRSQSARSALSSTAQLSRYREDFEAARVLKQRAEKSYVRKLLERKLKVTRKLDDVNRKIEQAGIQVPGTSRRSASSAKTLTRSKSSRSGRSGSLVQRTTKLETLTQPTYRVKYCGLSKEAAYLAEKMNEGHFVECALTGDNVVVAIDSDGHYVRSGEVPGAVRDFAKRDYVRHLALGSDNRFCILFKRLRPGCTGSLLKQRAGRTGVRCVAFGEKDVNLVVYNDGSFEEQGVPDELKYVLLDGKRKRKKATRVSLGPNGEYFVLFKGGHWIAHASDPVVRKLILQLEVRKDSLSVKNITFGKRAAIAMYTL